MKKLIEIRNKEREHKERKKRNMDREKWKLELLLLLTVLNVLPMILGSSPQSLCVPV
jgi:hypothetical protein